MSSPATLSSNKSSTYRWIIRRIRASPCTDTHKETEHVAEWKIARNDAFAFGEIDKSRTKNKRTKFILLRTAAKVYALCVCVCVRSLVQNVQRPLRRRRLCRRHRPPLCVFDDSGALYSNDIKIFTYLYVSGSGSGSVVEHVMYRPGAPLSRSRSLTLGSRRVNDFVVMRVYAFNIR